MTLPSLADSLRALELRRTAEDLPDLIARATKARWSPGQLLEEIARAETLDRARRSVERRLQRAHLGRFKPVADFDWSWPKRIDREAVERILTLAFVDAAENVVLVAPPGLGKTTLAKNVGHAAALAGKSVLFTTASDLLLDLNKQETARALEQRLRQYAGPQLLVIDDRGIPSSRTPPAPSRSWNVSRITQRLLPSKATATAVATRRPRPKAAGADAMAQTDAAHGAIRPLPHVARSAHSESGHVDTLATDGG